MRLLERHDDGGISLVEHFGDAKPPYAILSHTWGAEEVTYKDLIDGTGKGKVGYEKILFCGECARNDSLQYFWVDTCCIDKTNSTELQEAINSMFSWYREATKCYVYLSDVSAIGFNGDDQLSRKTWELEFSASRWFTRGWTLQELIAPRTLEFYSKERCPLGSKKTLEQAIHGITGIPVEAIRRVRPLHEFSVDERMSWAKERKTTRQEDAAYCLLGIFDIHMPLIYGEGRKKALVRLRKEIREAKNISSLSFKDGRTICFKTFTSSFNDAPVDLLSIHFMERKHELGLVSKAHQFSEESAATRCAIWGIPGVGKTQFALRYTKVFLEDSAVSAVFWMSCSSVEKLHQGFSKLLNLIDHPDQYNPEQNARVVAARRWLEEPEVSGVLRWLLVLDNVDLTTLNFLRENLPRQGKRGRILITTRTEAVAQALCKASGRLQLSFELETPAIEDVVISFSESVGLREDSMTSVGRQQITDLIKGLGRLPFAVEHAASFMTQSSQTIDSLTRLYRSDQKHQIFNWQNLFAAYEAKSISGMFASHLHNLRQSSPEVLALLNILVFWDPDRIELETIIMGGLSLNSSFEGTREPLKWRQHWHWARFLPLSLIRIPHFGFNFSSQIAATAASNLKAEENALPPCELDSLIKLMSSEVQLQSAFQQLQMLSFLKRRSAHEGGAYCMHDLTQTLVQTALESESTYLQWLRCAVKIACGAFRQIANPALPEFWHQYEGLISHILSLNNYSELVDYENVDLLAARANIAAYWCDRGRYHEARETYQKILGASSNSLHGTGVETTQWKLGLAEVNWHLGKHSEALCLYEELRQIQESQLGLDHPDALQVVERMALVYRSQARYAESCSMLEYVLKSRKTSLGSDHLHTIQTMDELATTIKFLGEYAEAESLHKQALARRTACLGTDHPDTLWTADNLATNYRKQGRYLEALELHERVLEGRKLRLGEDHPQTYFTITNIAKVYTSLGRLNEAEAMYKKSIAGNEQRLGHSQQQTLYVVEGLGDVYYQQGRFEEATSLYDRALRGEEECLGDGHPKVMRLMHKLANLYRDQSEFNKSAALFERLLERRKTRLRSSHPDILRTYHDAAASYLRLGKYVKAEQCYRLELAGSIEEFGRPHAETQKREQNLVRFLRDQELRGQVALFEVHDAVALKMLQESIIEVADGVNY